MIRIRYIPIEEQILHTFVLNEEHTLCGQSVPYGQRSFCTAPYAMFSRCPTCLEAEENLRALLALTGEEEPKNPFDRLHDNLFQSNELLEWLRRKNSP